MTFTFEDETEPKCPDYNSGKCNIDGNLCDSADKESCQRRQSMLESFQEISRKVKKVTANRNFLIKKPFSN